MKNQDVWDFANEFASELMYKFCLYCFLVPAIGYMLFPSYNFLITVIINTLLIVSVLYYTEKHLNKYFDKQGNRKSGAPHQNP